MDDIGYCNTCKNKTCTAPRIKVVPQRDCPKGLQWENGRKDKTPVESVPAASEDEIFRLRFCEDCRTVFSIDQAPVHTCSNSLSN